MKKNIVICLLLMIFVIGCESETKKEQKLHLETVQIVDVYKEKDTWGSSTVWRTAILRPDCENRRQIITGRYGKIGEIIKIKLYECNDEKSIL